MIREESGELESQELMELISLFYHENPIRNAGASLMPSAFRLTGIPGPCEFNRPGEFGAPRLKRFFLRGCHPQKASPDIVEHSLGLLEQL